MQRALYSEKRRRGEGPAWRPHLVAHNHVELLVSEEEHVERQEDHAHVGTDRGATAAPAQAARQPIPSAADRQVAAFREAVARVVVCRPYLHATPSRLQGQRRVQDQPLGTTHAQVWVQKQHRRVGAHLLVLSLLLHHSPELGPAPGALSLVRPPVALTWAPQDALPVKQWPPGRRVPPSGRGKMPAAEQGAQAAQPQQALGGCGDSTRKIRLASKLVLFQYWL
uniref:SEC61 translocon subunit beta n=1 Tax=Rousettus aegyptiacus TaxID=9407 RepID=A0A7J8IRA6_ROUAE|nr:SEC61 translocon subunit beta [Rousettus aegyptiacus]